MSSFIFPTNMIRIEFWVIKFIQSVHIITLFLCYPGCQHGYRKKRSIQCVILFYVMQVHVKRANQTAKDVVKGVRPIKLIFAFLLS